MHLIGGIGMALMIPAVGVFALGCVIVGKWLPFLVRPPPPPTPDGDPSSHAIARLPHDARHARPPCWATTRSGRETLSHLTGGT